MSSLHDQLEAAIKERLAVAQAATAGPWILGGQGHREPKHPNGETFCVSVEDDTRCRWVADTWDGPDAAHIAANGPDRIIRDCTEDLAVLHGHPLYYVPRDWHEWRTPALAGPRCSWCNAAWPCREVRSLACRYGITEASDG